MQVANPGKSIKRELICPALTTFFLLMKPRILVLLVITCWGGMFVATKGNGALLSMPLIFWTSLGLALSAGGANSVNMWYDADIDAVMTRTKNRPVPAGRIKPVHALYWGLFWGVVSHTLLYVTVGFWAAAMAFAGYVFYTIIYTMFLKTPHCPKYCYWRCCWRISTCGGLGGCSRRSF